MMPYWTKFSVGVCVKDNFREEGMKKQAGVLHVVWSRIEKYVTRLYI